jgi:HTH-type transcriptional repressor of NAD biosynthesis genes
MTQHKIGLVLGKFMPLTKGHELMIDFAASQVDDLVVIISSDDSSPAAQNMPKLYARAELMCKRYNQDSVSIIAIPDTFGEPKSVDSHGTSTDEEYLDKWVRLLKLQSPNATHFISSERYGNELAQRMGIKWVPVDPDREVIDISATTVRNSHSVGFVTHDGPTTFAKVSDVFKPILAKKVVVIGAESSGKSTLTRDLAAQFETSYAPEYGRILSEARQNVLDKEDFIDIVTGQHALNDAAAIASTGIYFVDTEAFTTYLFGDVYGLGKIHEIEQMAKNEKFDAIVIIPPVLSWVDDGTRVMPGSAERQKFYDDLVRFFNTYHADTPMCVVSSMDRDDRVNEVGEWLYWWFYYGG